MLLNETKPNIESSGQLEEQFFSIQDQGMIFDILRNKMYSNPILAICREISCNARDAHREIGKQDEPIHIHLPNSLEPFYKIRDFGPGISPDRMSNIFIKYTASTKRSDNLQTGGFGLGAKTPFSYSDTFTIKTNHNGIQYNYACFIDETKVGKLSLLSEAPTTEANGTEIITPVKPVDFKLFNEWTEHSTRHWDVKPIIKGGDIRWNTIKSILTGSNWVMEGSDVYSKGCKLIIDGIEYPVSLDALRKYASTVLIDSARGNLYLYFGVGELSLSASREQVYLDEPTQLKISGRINQVLDEIKQTVLNKIDSFPNLWEANIYYRKDLYSAFNDIKFLGPLTWKNCRLSNHHLSVSCPVFNFSKGNNRYYYRSSDPNKIRRHSGNSLSFEEKSVLFINDLGLKEPTPRHVKKAFDEDSTLASVQVICPTDKITLDFLNQNIHLDEMKPKFLSSITKASSRKSKPASARLLVFKFDPGPSAFRQVSYASIEENANKKVLCRLSKDECSSNRDVILKNKNSLGLQVLRSLSSKFTDHSFYGVDAEAAQDRIDDDFEDFIDIEVFLENQILKNKKIDYVEIKYGASIHYEVDNMVLRHVAKFRNLITNPKSLFLEKIELHEKIRKLANEDTGILGIYESINGKISQTELDDFEKNHPEYNIKSINERCLSKYPLLMVVSSYSYSEAINHIIQYINLVDTI